MNSRLGSLFIISLLSVALLGCDNKKQRAPIVQEETDSQEEARNVEAMIKSAVEKQREK